MSKQKGQDSRLEQQDGTPEDAEAGGPITIASDEEPGSEPLVPSDPLDEPMADIRDGNIGDLLEEPAQVRSAVEALLFASPGPLSVKKISNALNGLEAKVVRAALTDLTDLYETEARGMVVSEVAGGFTISTREQFSEFINRLGAKKKRQTLSPATLETLAIVAYRQPIIRATIESIRGVESSGTVRNLLDHELIEVVGRKEVIGRPSMYGTTAKFLDAFGLKNLKDLPSIRGLLDRFSAEAAEAEAKAEEEAAKAAKAASEEADANEEQDASIEEAPDQDDPSDATDEAELEDEFDEDDFDDDELDATEVDPADEETNV